MRAHRLFPALLLALAAGACRDLPTTAVAPVAPSQPQTERAQLRCSVQVAERTMTCVPPGPRGARSNIILGGQGLNVRLATSNVSFFPGDNVMTALVTLQNLLDQPIGTDGSSTYGSRVFFTSGPVVTEGTGAVDVLTDSTGTFTASNQKYYIYPEVLQPRQVSLPQVWTFSVDPTVVRFDFVVLVETQLPAETSILHFRPEQGAQVYLSDINAVWAGSPHDVFAVSDGSVLHFDGNYWRAMDAGTCGCEAGPLYGVWGSSGSNVFAVGENGIMHWTGGNWYAEPIPDLGTNFLYSVWGTSDQNAWAVGDGGTILHYDGTWTSAGSEELTTASLYSVWGANAEDVWAVGDGGTVLHFDGTDWSQPDTLPNTTLYVVWGTGSTDVWAAGEEMDGGFQGVLWHYDGTEWSEVSDPEISLTTLYAGWSGGTNDVYVASGGEVIHWDGSTWTRQVVGSGAPIWGINGADAQHVFAVGSFATIARNGGGGAEWETMSLPESDILSLWGSSASDVWAAAGPILYHRGAGGTWSWDFPPEVMTAVWGTGASDVWAAGLNGTVARYDGDAWTTVHVDSTISTLWALWGSSPSDVWAAGDSGAVLHWDGGAWSKSSLGEATVKSLWGSGSNDVFAASTDGSVHHWNGGGWTPMTGLDAVILFGVWGSGPSDVYAAGYDGVGNAIYHYDGNVDLEWTRVATPVDGNDVPVTAIWGSGPNDVFAAADFGDTLLHWDGVSWKVISSYSVNAGVHMYAIWGTGSRNVYLAGDMGTILHGQR